MSRRFKQWMTEVWFFYLVWGTMLATILGGFGVAMEFTPVVSILLSVFGYGMVIGLRAVQYIGYDFSAPDND
jgi:energy-converting hydrogenase Eha subunit C